MTTSPKFSLHSQWEHPFPSELLLYTNQRGQLLVFVMVWTLLGWKSAATICIKWEGAQNIIIESVDSICRDSADTQYRLIQTNFSKSPKQLTHKSLQHLTVHLWVFSWRTTHPVALKCIAKVPYQKVARRPKCFSFFWSSVSSGFFFYFFRRASSNLRDSFTMIFTQNSSIFHWAVHQPIAFSTWLLVRQDRKYILKV